MYLFLSGQGRAFQSQHLAPVPKGIRVHGVLGLALEDSFDLHAVMLMSGHPCPTRLPASQHSVQAELWLEITPLHSFA